MTKNKLFNDILQWGILAALVTVAMPDLALADIAASTDVSSLTKNFGQSELPALPYILGAVCYVGGAFMLVSGALKLKAHAESPAQEKLAPGVARLIAGGAITAVPALTKVVQGSTLTGSQQATFTNFSTSF